MEHRQPGRTGVSVSAAGKVENSLRWPTAPWSRRRAGGRSQVLGHRKEVLSHADHEKQHRHRQGPRHLVHRRRLHRRRRRRAQPRTGAGQPRPLHRARTAWHAHPLGQTIYVTEGVGLCQKRGGPIEVIRPGDRVFFAPDEEHWHGAAANRFMVHLALNEVDDDHVAANWGDKVTDDEYAAAPANQA